MARRPTLRQWAEANPEQLRAYTGRNYRSLQDLARAAAEAEQEPFGWERKEPQPLVERSATIHNKDVNDRVLALWRERRDFIGASAKAVAAALGLTGKDPANTVRKTKAWREVRPMLLAEMRAGKAGVAFELLVGEQAMPALHRKTD